MLRETGRLAVAPSHWVNAALQDEEMAAQDKARVYRAVADLQHGRDSAVGMLALLLAQFFTSAGAATSAVQKPKRAATAWPR